MPDFAIKLSPRVQRLFDSGKLDAMFTATMEELGRYFLGRSKSTTDKAQAPAVVMFNGRWRSGGNKAQQRNWDPGARAYSQGYEEWKEDFGSDYFLVESGALYDSAITKARINAKKDSVTISTSGAPKYAPAHQYGTAKMPARPFYVIDEKQKNAMRTHLFKTIQQLLTHAGNDPVSSVKVS